MARNKIADLGQNTFFDFYIQGKFFMVTIVLNIAMTLKVVDDTSSTSIYQPNIFRAVLVVWAKTPFDKPTTMLEKTPDAAESTNAEEVRPNNTK